MKLAIVIPSWNAADFIPDCLRSLEAQTVPADIIVVDNGSADDSVAMIEKSFPSVHLIKLPSNHGFAGGVNAGLKYALKNDYDAVALFNNDAVAEPDWLAGLAVELDAHPEAGIVTGKLMRDDKRHVDSVGECYSVWGIPFPSGRNHLDKGQFNSAGAVFGATGGASLYRLAALKEIGLFDEEFFAYLEDVDLSFRARLAAWEVRYTPNAIAYHKVGVTSSKLGSFTRYHFIKNFHLAYLKNMPGWLFWRYLPLAVLQSCRLALGALVRGHGLTFVRAYLAAVWLIPYTLGQRRRIQKSRQVPLAVIDGLLYHDRPPRQPRL